MDVSAAFRLTRSAGNFRLGPADINVPTHRRYLPGTMVLETSWGTGDGWIIVRDVLLIGPWHHERDRSGTHRRAPTGLRRITTPTMCCCEWRAVYTARSS